MRHRSALSMLKWTLSTLALGLCIGPAYAQTVFDDQDWTIDRGRINVNNAYDPNVARRQGYNNFQGTDTQHLTNNPQHALPRWVWPATVDINAVINSTTIYTDNPYPGIDKVALSNGFQANDALSLGSPNGYALAGGNGSWIIPDPANRVYNGGFSYVNDPTVISDFDYGIAVPTQQEFDYTSQAATIAQLEALPYVSPDLYSDVQNKLIKLTTGNNAVPAAIWTIGTNVNGTNALGVPIQIPITPGNYGIDIWSPGDGTLSVDNLGNQIIHPNLFHVLVRVSWFNTVNVNNTINFGPATAGGGGVNDPQYSRIFMVDMTGLPGWRHIAPSGSSSSVTPLTPSAFPFDGTHANQISVELYSITPDNLSDTNLYANPPFVTADAVRFTAVSVLNPDPTKYNPATNNLAVISPSGSIQAPVVGSYKIANKTAGDPSTNQNLYYVARQEQILNPIYYPPPAVAPVPPDPTKTTLTPGNDNTEVVSVPVFYCLTNVDEADGASATGELPSKQRVRWRYVATPDLGNGSSIASPLLASVRCRDNTKRDMVFFVTSTPDGTLGHIYALDPLGANPYDGFNGNAADPGDLRTRTTTAYWVYPSYRPDLTVTDINGVLHQAANEPVSPPAEWEDPNFTLPTNLTNGLGRAGYPAATFGADQTLAGNGNEIYDGDIKAQNVPTQPYVTREDTRLTMSGMAWTPTLIDDPDNLAGPQILIVGGKSYNTTSGSTGGRLYAFDAGGRGDFGTVTNANAVVSPAAGTTQRLWTWPHFGADAFHKIYTAANYATQAFTIQDDQPVGYLSGAPMYDTQYPNVGANGGHSNYIPLVVGSTDGHLYAILPFHDNLTVVSNNIAYYDNREEWAYPNPNLDGGVGLGASPSTPSLLVTSTGKRLLYFTDDGNDSLNPRVYCVPEAPLQGQAVTNPIVNTLYWVYPYTPAPPLADPNNSANTQPLTVGFASSAPIAINAAAVNYTGGRTLPAALQIPYDMVYVVQNDGTVTGLQADPGNNGGATTLFTQGPAVTSTTTVTPNVSLIWPSQTDGLFDYDPALQLITDGQGVTPYNISFPSLVFGDDAGGIYGFGLSSVWNGDPAQPDPDPNGNQGVGTVLPLDWGYVGRSDASHGRYAPVSLVHSLVAGPDNAEHGYMLQGDQFGQLFAYSIGTGTNGLGSTVGNNEQAGQGNNQDLVDIDIRVVDYYKQSDWNNFMLPLNNAGMPESPAHWTDANGAAHGPLTQPAPATLSAALDPAGGVAADWGENVYVAAWGVYHAQPQDKTQKVYGLNVPQINVTFTIQQPGGTTAPNQPVTVPAVIQSAQNIYWPGDAGFIAQGGKYSDVYIWGEDPNTTGDTNGHLLEGGQNPSQNVYVWVAKTRFPILPDANHPYAPGLSGIRVSAWANISQNVRDANGTENLTYKTPILFAGQKDLAGKSTGGQFQTSPNDVYAHGQPRPLYITNPLALSTRGYNGNVADLTGIGSSNVIGWAGAIDNPNINITDPREVLGNGSNLGLPGAAAANFTGANKSLMAPLDMTTPGSSVQYMGLDNNNVKVPALYAMDRSNYYKASAHKLQFRVVMPSLSWHGGLTSVMNPLPWEQLPDDQHDTIDYPAISANNIQITTPDGDNVTQNLGYLAPPTPGAGVNADALRTPNPVLLTMSVAVPKYQPANVNRGPVKIGNFNYGSTLTDDANHILGTNTNPLLGPISTVSGNTPTAVQNRTFPAGGYVARGIQVSIQPVGQGNRRTPVYNGYQAGQRNQVWRQFIAGMCVAPQFNMHVEESTLDLGKLPMGAGYTDLNGGAFRQPFAPTGTGIYQNYTNGVLGTSPWDDEQSLGKFFRPFTLVSDSNVNLIDLRINKLYGVLGATINSGSLTTNPDPNTAVANRLSSDQVSDTLSPPILGVPFGLPGSNAAGNPLALGNIGFVSSFDHNSDTNNPNSAFNKTSEGPLSLYPIKDPALDANAVTQLSTLANNGLLLDAVNAWSLNGTAALPRPTLHKPRVGDSNGTQATIPDVPRSFTSDALQNQGTFAPLQPEIGIAIPQGTPVGTYTGTIIPYEDREPTQWREWLRSSNGALYGSDLGNEDGVFNVTSAGAPLEPYANPAPKLKVTVREGRLTNGTYAGSLSQIDLLDPLAAYNIGKDSPTTQSVQGFNTLPAIYQVAETSNLAADLFLYWSTNRQPGANYLVPDLNNNPVPGPNAPVGLAYSDANLFYQSFVDPISQQMFFRGDGNFAIPANNGNLSAQWWKGSNLYLTYQNAGLFPTGGNGDVQGTVVPNTVKFYSPAVASANTITGNGVNFAFNPTDPEGYLFYVGQADKVQPLATASTSGGAQTESRLFWESLNTKAVNGNPSGNPSSLLNSPAVPKLSPKPLLVKLGADTTRGVPAEKMLYLFWASGSQGRTSLYYNANAYSVNGANFALNAPNATITNDGWQADPTNPNDPRLGDQKLPSPDALEWQSDPHPVFRRIVAKNPFVTDPADPAYGYRVFDTVDLYYTGVLRNRQSVEILMTRYAIYRGESYGKGNTVPANVKIGQLIPLQQSTVVDEEMTPLGGSNNTFQARDVSWYTGEQGLVVIKLQRRNNNGVPQTYILNGDPNNPGQLQQGRFDPASGLIYFDAVSINPNNGQVATGANNRPIFGGGKIVVDARSGAIRFPDIAPFSTDTVLVTYTPQVMRLNTSRDQSNLIDSFGYGNFATNPLPAAFLPHPGIVSPGSNSAATVIIDRTANPRQLLTSPQVVFNVGANQAMTTDRLWALYRKSDLSGTVKSTVYWKSMRLMAKLPTPFALNNNKQIANLTVNVDAADPNQGALGPYEADWVRGRVYFTEGDEGRIVDINYSYVNGNGQATPSGRLVYRVAWGDEPSTTGTSPDETTPETALPTDSAINEGQVTAFKDLYLDRLWIFWSSTRSGTTDLYYETFAPQLYPHPAGQQ